MDVTTHYDLLIDENNDLFRDPPILQEYMNTWDGQVFLESLKLDKKRLCLKSASEQVESLLKLLHIVCDWQGLMFLQKL